MSGGSSVVVEVVLEAVGMVQGGDGGVVVSGWY
jgi:hypothetical protein